MARTKKFIPIVTKEEFECTKPHICQCINSCNQEIEWKDWFRSKGIPMYKKGHNISKMPIKITKEQFNITSPHYCNCYDNDIIEWQEWFKYRGIPIYTHNHDKRRKKMSEETKKKLSDINKGEKSYNYGKHPSKETRNKLSKAKIGIHNPFYGKHHTEESKQKNREWHIGKIPPPVYKYWKGCYYNSPLQKKIWLRSTYELSYARWLDSKKIVWLYEAFTFPITCGTYTPDFYLVEEDKFIEIKGYMRPESKIKIEQFIKEYPSKRIDILYKNDLLLIGCMFT